MKKLILLAFFLVNFFDSYCQNNVFAIDSIPKEGILLNKGWKFHAGDNPDFAKAYFDDSKWESIDPTQDVMDLKQFEKGNLGWFRLTFKVDSTLFGQSFALSIKQTGSSQIYINGVLVKQIGEFSTKTISSKGYDPAGTPIQITFAKSEKQTFSIKFEKPNMFMVKRIELPNVCFFFKITKVEEIINNYEYKSDVDIIELNFINVLSGIYFLVAFLHFWLYSSNKKSISNLIFSVVSILMSILFFIYTFCFRPISIDIRNNLYILISTLEFVLEL